MKMSKNDKNEITKALGLFTHIGLTMAICIVGCIFFGKWLDGIFNTSPIFLLIFVVLGALSAIYSLYKIVTAAIK